jgi:hypothetical protein
MQVNNGVRADQLSAACWRKSRVSNPTGCCVEAAALPGGEIAVRNSRHPSGPALIYTRAEVAAFLTGVKNGEFDDLCPDSAVSLQQINLNGFAAVRRRGNTVISCWVCRARPAWRCGGAVVTAWHGGPGTER